MDTFETIKKFLNNGGKCLLIEDGKAVGVVLTIAEYEKLSISEIDNKPPQTPPYQGGDKGEVVPANPTNPIGETLAQEMDYAEASADLADIQAVDDVTLDDLGLDELQ